MDPYGSQPPQRREQQPAPSGTPIYDRLEVGRVPDAIAVGGGELRDDITMWMPLT
ncbi:hypothetical protein ACFU77_36175 [Streptomyces fimicarius]|uniref:hypothetical protein n=1 Tax=Streptomyces griseus TaxID=1911 RepID=UPI00369C5C98